MRHAGESPANPDKGAPRASNSGTTFHDREPKHTMSHFSALVIGDDIAAQLQRFHEFECTGCNDQYVQDVDQTDEVTKQISESGTLNDALDYFGLSERTVRCESDIDREGTHKYGYALISEKSELVRAVKRTNPNAHWDYWTEGGRMSGMLKLKTGERVNSATKGEIDWDGMRDEAAEKYGEEYAMADAIIGHLPVNESWNSMRERIPNMDEARTAFWKQPRCAVWEEAKKKIGLSEWPFGWSSSPDDYASTREEYIQRGRNKAGVTFAVVKDGKWFERGRMGWWGCVSNEKDEETWNTMFQDLINDLNDDTLLTVVDCHI